jgi:hypothetical protein
LRLAVTLEGRGQTADTFAASDRSQAMAKPVSMILAVLAVLSPAAPAAAALIMYSYDSSNPQTEAMTEQGVTLMLDKTLTRLKVVRLVETLNVGQADLKPASEADLGHGGLARVLGDNPKERDLYEIVLKDDGRALTNALCSGADKAWLAFGPIKQDRALVVDAIGRDPSSGQAHLCMTLTYAFHGVWTLPPVDLPQPDRSDRFNSAPANRRY